MSPIGTIGVAISTTGDEHRLPFLETCVRAWKDVLPLGSVLVVTVDGDADAVSRVAYILNPILTSGGNIYQVGQGRVTRDGHQGVAVNKNTGLSLLMGHYVRHLFLCDDDTWPLSRLALDLHLKNPLLHSMVCWGKNRMGEITPQVAEWTWPRGVLLYVTCTAVEQVGGMDEQFGPGGHEHVEWSRRIHQAGLTPAPFVSPDLYAADRGQGARRFWHAEDMPRAGEQMGNHRLRRRRLTSVRREESDWAGIEKIMDARDGDTSFVPYDSAYWGRSSATLYREGHAEEQARAEEPKEDAL